jgi:hypothetical protein
MMGIATSQKTSPHRHRAAIAVEILLALFTAALIMGGFIRILPTLLRQPGSYDFAAYYVAARVLNAQDVLYDDARMADAATIGSEKVAFPRYIYPPFFATFLRPLATLPFITASRIWFVFNLVCLWIAIGLLSRLVGLSRRWMVVLGLVALTLPPIYDTLLLGQVNLLLLLLLTLALYFTSLPEPRRWQEILAGFLLGVAVLIKIYPVALGLAYLLHRRIISLISMMIGILAMSIVGIVFGGGVENTLRYFGEVLPELSGGGPLIADQSISPVMARLFSFNHYQFAFMTPTNFVEITLAPVIDLPWLGYLLALLGSLIIIFFTLRNLVTRFLRNQLINTSSMLFDFSLVITMTLIILPIVHDHYLTLLYIPIFFIIKYYNNQEKYSIKYTIRVILTVFVLLLALQRFWRVFLNIIPSPLLLCFGFCGMLLLWLVLLRLSSSSLHQGTSQSITSETA